MNFHMTKEEVLAVLQKAGKVDLSIPESKKQEILNNPSLKGYVDSIEKYAAARRGTPIPALPYSDWKLVNETGNRLIFENGKPTSYFPRRGRLAAFGLSAWLHGREDDIHELEDVLWAVCDEYTWSLPSHLKREKNANAFVNKLEYGDYMVDLFASETASALSEIVSLVGDKLAPIVKKRIAYLLEERIFSRVLTDTFWWMSGKSNWAAVCAGSVGMAAIHAIEDDEHLAEVLARILPAFEAFLQSYAADGACIEGIGYWNYGFSYYVSFADMLLRRTRGELDMFAIPLVEKIASFQRKCYFKGGRTVSFSDSNSHVKYHPGLACYLSRRYEGVTPPPACAMGDFNRDTCYRWSNVLRDLLWTDDLSETPEVYGCHPLPDAPWYICSGAEDVGIAAKGGHNDEPHNHNDVGSFQVFKNGEEIFADFGSGEYTIQAGDPQIRYTIFNHGSQGHNLPIIDGCTQHIGEDACARNVTVDETGIAMDIAPAYKLDFMPSLQRDVRFDRAAGTVTLTDVFAFTEGKHEVRERFVTFGHIAVEPGCIVVKVGEEAMAITYDPAVFTPELSTASYPDHSAVVQTANALDLVAKAQGEFTAAMIISPVK